MSGEELNYDDVLVLMRDRCPECMGKVFLTDKGEGCFELICPNCREIYTLGGVVHSIFEQKSHNSTEIE